MIRIRLLSLILLLGACWCGADGPPRPPAPAPVGKAIPAPYIDEEL